MVRLGAPSKKRASGKASATVAQARNGFRRVRAAHASETAQDYAEAIAQLAEERGAARVVDLAALLGVSHVTVVRTVARLRRQGLVKPDAGAGIWLTAAGQREARAAKERHRTVVAFLLALGVDARTAEEDAEGIEHHVSAATLAAFRRFAKTRA